MVLCAIQDRINDYYEWCAKCESPEPELVWEDKSEYEYFHGFGLALELALDIVRTLQNSPGGNLETEIRRSLRKQRHRGINTDMILWAVRDRVDDYNRRCTKYECPETDFDWDQESEYEYFKGYGLALQLALDIMQMIHRLLFEKGKQVGA